MMERSMVLSIEAEMILRLVLAAFLGFLIGLERAFSGQPAGERTHALVALGSATFAVLSVTVFQAGDPIRIAAGVVTGLGFLGAGMIWRRKGEEIQGLTTAAGIWSVGGVGLAIGAGEYLLGISVAILVVLFLWLDRVLRIDERVARRRAKERSQEETEVDKPK
jgi:putative Mg2+ transporter-C (MgtC) family protein